MVSLGGVLGRPMRESPDEHLVESPEESLGEWLREFLEMSLTESMER